MLREERIRAEMPMIRLAEKSGLSVAMISYVERGARNPTLDTLLRIAIALDVDLWKLLKQASLSAKMKRADEVGAGSQLLTRSPLR